MVKLFFILIFYSCFNFALAQNKTPLLALVIGKCSDTSWKEQSLRRFDLLLQDDIFLQKTKINPKDSSFVFRISIDSPTIAQLSNSRIFISPGDTVSILTNGSHIYYSSGSNRGNYLYYSILMQKSLAFLRRSSKYEADWTLFKKDLSVLMERKNYILDSLNESGNLSDEFYLFTKKEILYSYHSQLLSFLVDKRAEATNLYSTEDFEEMEQLVHLKEPSNLSIQSVFFQEFAANYLKFKFRNTENKEDKLAKGIKFIKSNYDSISIEALMCYWFFHYSNYHITTDNSSLFDSLYNENSVLFKDLDYKMGLQKIYAKIHGIETKISIDIQQTVLSYSNNNHIFFGKVLDENKHSNYCVIDFWASWCKPCITDRINSPSTKKLFKSEKVNLISISIDKSQADWKKALKKYGWETNEFLLLEPENEKLLSGYHIKAIPHLILVDASKREVMCTEAPRLSFFNSWVELLDYLKRRK